MFQTIGKIIRESLQDNATGRYSSSRVIALLVAFAATVFMWKLVLLGGMTIEFFTAYLLYGTGSFGVGKFLDNKDDSRHVQAKAAIAAPAEEEELPKPPKV
jgi:hypothetical protein